MEYIDLEWDVFLRGCKEGCYTYRVGKWLGNRNVLRYLPLVDGFLWVMLLERSVGRKG